MIKSFLQIIKSKPEILHRPEISFFKEFLQSFGAIIPPPTSKTEKPDEPKTSAQKPENVATSDSDSEEIEESDVELDNTGVIGK